MHESPDSGEWLAHAHRDLDNGYQALFFVPANFNVKIGPGDEARMQHEVLTQRAAEPCQQVMMLSTTMRTDGSSSFYDSIPFGGWVRL